MTTTTVTYHYWENGHLRRASETFANADIASTASAAIRAHIGTTGIAQGIQVAQTDTAVTLRTRTPAEWVDSRWRRRTIAAHALAALGLAGIGTQDVPFHATEDLTDGRELVLIKVTPRPQTEFTIETIRHGETS